MNITDHELSYAGETVPWRLFEPEGAGMTYAVLWLYGWRSSMDGYRLGIGRMAERSGVVFATMDYAGHGRHGVTLEESTRRRQHEEVVAVFDELVRRGYERIVVIGASFGGYMAALLAGVRPVHVVVLRVPANYPDAELDVPYGKTTMHRDKTAYAEERREQDSHRETMATRAIEAFGGVVYVMEHELDEVVPPDMVQRYFEAAREGNYLLVPRTGHSPKLMADPQVHYDYIEHMLVMIVGAVVLRDRMASSKHK